MAERRTVPRNRTLKSGKIRVSTRMSLIDCTIRNLSTKGALLLVPNILDIPDEFKLEMSDRTTRDCRVTWRGDNRVGVEFAQNANARPFGRASINAGSSAGAGPSRSSAGQRSYGGS
jgi:hypothetical protein